MAAPLDRHTSHTDSISVQEAARSSALEMSKYFGPLRNTDVETFASDAFAHETHNLPKAYEGRNKFLMATIDFLITKDDDWYTRFVLPWCYTEELHVKWNIWRFNRTMMDYEPEQGVPRYVSYESESRSDSLVRRGLAFIIEHGFYKTEIGRQHYLMNLKQIVEAVHETVYYGVIHELLASPNFYQQWQQRHGNHHSIMQNDATTTLAEERWRFACVQKDVKGLFVLDAEIKDRMRRVGIEPDAWVFPSKMAIYASMIPEYFNEYSRGGQQATTALENGAKRFDTFRGNRVFETRSFDTDFMNAGATEPLTRNRQVGEYYVLGDHADDYAHGMQIFDMSTDAFKTITHDHALKNAHGIQPGCTDNAFNEMVKRVPMHTKSIAQHIQDEFGTTIDFVALEAGAAPGRGAAETWYATLIRRWPGIVESVCNIIANHRQSMGVQVGQGQAADIAHFVNDPTYTDNAANTYLSLARFIGADTFGAAGAVDQDYAHVTDQLQDIYAEVAEKHQFIVFPYKLLVFRPRQTYRMSTALLLKGGEELGQTMHGHHDFQLTDDVIHKTHIGHYTFYSKSVVRDPKLMYHAEDVYCSGYVGGENTLFFGPDEQAVQNELDLPLHPGSHSLIAVPVRYSEQLGAFLSVTGSLDDVGITTRDNASGSYSTCKCLGIPRGAVNTNPETSFLDDSDAGETGINGVCFRGAQKRYHHDSGEWKTHTLNTGHWGPNVYDGCGMVRMGMYAHLKTI